MPGQVIRAIKKPRFASRLKKLAATYSRGIYKTTTIGNAAFHGRVRNGNGWDHCFMTTRKIICVENPSGPPQRTSRLPVSPRLSKSCGSLKTTHRMRACSSRIEIAILRREKERSSRTTD